MSDEDLVNENMTKAQIDDWMVRHGHDIVEGNKAEKLEAAIQASLAHEPQLVTPEGEVIDNPNYVEPEGDESDADPDAPTAESGVFEPEHNEDELITHDFLGTPIADIDYPPSKPEYAQAYQHPVV